ncbi:MAG: hypothetical protein LAO03_14260 [Acidobacteriia bacterium]|nr:hypothetical protein [Terriglobia bacterium]
MKRWQTIGLGVLLLALIVSVGCARQPGVQAADENATDQQLPFDRASDKGGISPTGSLMPAAIPAGTPVTVRLQTALSSEASHSGDSFEAVLDEPIIVQGQTVAPRGATVTGTVVAAKASGRLHDPGYLRLTLSAISLNGKSLPVQTSSIFAKGGSHEKRNLAMIGGGAGGGALIGGLAGGGKGALIGSLIGAGGGTGAAYATGKKEVGFSAERRLTFRLTQPLATKG